MINCLCFSKLFLIFLKLDIFHCDPLLSVYFPYLLNYSVHVFYSVSWKISTIVSIAFSCILFLENCVVCSLWLCFVWFICIFTHNYFYIFLSSWSFHCFFELSHLAIGESYFKIFLLDKFSASFTFSQMEFCSSLCPILTRVVVTDCLCELFFSSGDISNRKNCPVLHHFCIFWLLN